VYGYEIALACIKTNLRLENTTFKKKCNLGDRGQALHGIWQNI
jgi:hypothetical protein